MHWLGGVMGRKFLLADLFCGAGGSSTGAARAIERIGGELVMVCVNHDKTAIATHRKNHPNARHFIEDLNGADPERLVPERRLDLLMASPECRFHSRARGGKPINDQMRMSAYAIQRWLTALNVRCLLVENVPEFIEWGPLCTLEKDHQGAHVHDALSEPREACDLPDPTKKRLYFEAWLRNIWELGYEFDYRILNAADFGDATTRERFFLQARKDGRPIRWPDPSHGKPGSGGGMFGHLKPWRAAREVIDWSDPGRSLLDDAKYRKTPLSPKTRMRIARGLARFGGPLAPLYIDLLGIDPSEVVVPPGRGQKPRPFVFANRNHNAPKAADVAPVPTITSASGGGSYLVTPDAEPFVLAQGGGGEARPVSAPIPTVLTAGYETLVTPFMIGQHTNNVPKGVDEEPIPAVTTVSRIRLIEPALVEYYGQGGVASIDGPVPTITTKDRFALVDPLAVPYGPRAEARPIDEPLPTILTKDRLAVASPTAEPFIVSRQGHNDPRGRVRSVDQPLSTITGSGSGTGYLVEPFIVPKFGEAKGQAPRIHSIGDPLPTVTGDGAGRLVQPVLVQTDQTGGSGLYARTVEDPLPTVVTKQSMAIVEPVLRAVESGDVDPRRVVLIDGRPYLLDIRFRMLKNRELARAMGFDDDESKYEFSGTQSQITKQIGNAVPCNLAAALVGAILAEQVEPAESVA